MSDEEIFARLAAPFRDDEVKWRQGDRGRQLAYIDAAAVRRRLNEVVGPFNWWCTVEPLERGVRYRLSISLPEGAVVTREALGGYTDAIPNLEDRFKSGDTDGFKRAAVMFGIGDYLHDLAPGHAPAAGRRIGDHLHELTPGNAPAAAPRAAPREANGPPPPPRQGFNNFQIPPGDRPRAFYAWIKHLEQHYQTDLLKTVVPEIAERWGQKPYCNDWPPAEAEGIGKDLVEYIKSLTVYGGEFGPRSAPEPAAPRAAPPSPVDGDDDLVLRELKHQIVANCRKSLSLLMGDKFDEAKLADQIRFYSSEVQDGQGRTRQEMPSLKDCRDVVWLSNLNHYFIEQLDRATKVRADIDRTGRDWKEATQNMA